MNRKGTTLKKNFKVLPPLKEFLIQRKASCNLEAVEGKKLRRVYDDARARGIPMDFFDDPNNLRCAFLFKEKKAHTLYTIGYQDLYWAFHDKRYWREKK